LNEEYFKVRVQSHRRESKGAAASKMT
jgi:hypothetical protein